MRAVLIQDMIVTCPHEYGMLYNEAEHKFSILRRGGHLDEMITIPSDDLEEAAQKGYTDASFKVKDGEREKLKKQAHKHEKNISEFLRWLIEKQRKEDEGK